MEKWPRNVRSKAGNAWVEPSVGLGHPLDLPPPPLSKDTHHDNSRDRHRNRRAAEKLNNELKETEEVLRNKTEYGKDHAEVDQSFSDTENLIKTLKVGDIDNQTETSSDKQVRGTHRCVNACMDIQICKVKNLQK